METKTDDIGVLTPEELAEFQKSIEGLPPAEANLKLQAFAKDKMGEGGKVKEDPHQEKAVEQATFQLSDEQLDRVLEANETNVKKAIEDVAARGDILGVKDGKSRAEQLVVSRIQRKEELIQENQLIANVFAEIAKASVNEPNKLDDTYKEEAEYLQMDTCATSDEKRAMTVGTDTSGGFLSPELWLTQVYESLAKTSLGRRFATMISMNTELLRLPKITTGLSANIVGELVAATPAQPVFAQFTLQPQKLVVLTKAFSHELMVNANPAIVPILVHLATIGFGRKEDEMVFVGSDASVTGLLENTNNVVTMSSGNTAITATDFDDMADLPNALDEQYMPDADVENSGGIAGTARNFANKKLYNVLQKLKGNDNYFWGDVASSRPREIWGQPSHRVIDMPSAPAANTAFASFVNLSFVYFGHRPQIFIDLLKEATIDSVNLATSSGMALRMIEYVDTELIDDNAVANLKTAAS